MKEDVAYEWIKAALRDALVRIFLMEIVNIGLIQMYHHH